MMTDITPVTIAKLRDLLAKATPRPWVNMDDDTFFGQLRATDADRFELVAEMPELDDRTADFDLIEAAVNNLPALLDEVERLKDLVSMRQLENAYKTLMQNRSDTTGPYPE